MKQSPLLCRAIALLWEKNGPIARSPAAYQKLDASHSSYVEGGASVMLGKSAFHAFLALCQSLDPDD
jgi:hypothetical protein